MDDPGSLRDIVMPQVIEARSLKGESEFSKGEEKYKHCR